MATDGQAFNKVKNLLNRMDRSIDEARDKRLGKSPTDGPMIGAGPGPVPAPATASPEPRTAIQTGSPLIGAPATAAPLSIGVSAASPDTSKSGYGRAKPLTRPTSPDNSTRRWGT